jgi:predicted SprT family Zn-dependent metalloprotease
MLVISVESFSREDMTETCANCGEDLPTQRYHIHLSTGEVLEIVLCEQCHQKFVTADWVDAMI